MKHSGFLIFFAQLTSEYKNKQRVFEFECRSYKKKTKITPSPGPKVHRIKIYLN